MDWDELLDRSSGPRPFTAMYPGECDGCGSDIEPGDEVAFVDEILHHLECVP